MATVTSTFAAYASMTSELRAYGAAISAMWSAVGLVKTADTGQIDWTTVNHPGSSAGSLIGYEIWRFNDSLQATAPVFIRIEYRFSANYAYTPILAIGIGSGTNGAGALTGAYTDPAQFKVYAGADSSSYPHYASGDGSYLTFVGPARSATSATNFCQTYVIERWRNADGTPNGDGATILWCPNSTTTGRAQHIKLNAPGAAPTRNLATSWTNQTRIEGGDVGLSPIYPGVMVLRPPMLCAWLYYRGDIQPDGAEISVPMYGVARTYKAFGLFSTYWHSDPTAQFSDMCSMAILWQ